MRLRAEQMVRANAEARPVNVEPLSAEETQRTLHELRVHQIQLEIQHEELLQTQQELEESRASYVELYDFAPVGYCTIDEQGLILKANLTATRLLDVPRDVLVGLPFSRLIVPQDVAVFHFLRKQLFETGEPQVCELRLLRQDAPPFWVLLEASSAARVDNGAPKGFLVMHDIGRRKGADEALQDIERRHRAILQTSMDGFALTDLSGRLLEVNETYCRMVGYGESELLAMRISDLEANETESDVASHFRSIIATGEDRFDSRHRCKTGCLIDVEVSVHHRTMGGGQFVVFLRDITEQKRTQEALLEAEERYRQLFASASDALFLISVETGQILEANDMASALYGYDQAEFLVRKSWDLSAEPEETQRRTFAFKPELNQVVAIPLHLHRRKDGTVFPVELTARAFSLRGEPVLLVSSRDITERMRMQDQLLGASRTLELAQAAANAGAWDWTIGSEQLAWSPELFHLLGLDPGTTTASFQEWERAVHPEDRALARQRIDLALQEKSRLENEYRIVLPDGRMRWISALGQATYDDQGRPLRMSGICVDITDRKNAEGEREKLLAQLAHSQKTESIGRLAGGVAHDFNNLLTVINGYSRLLLEDGGLGATAQSTLNEILKAGERAAGLTAQLLAYSRRQVLQPRRLDLNNVVREMRSMLQRLMGEDVELLIALRSAEGAVHADPHQLEQVVMNLAVNARDAMPNGGRLLIETSSVELDEKYVRTHPGVQVGRYVTLAVSDTGTGMDEETRRRIFEPFFTTKIQGKGTGLGLSMVQGIVAQSNGHVEVKSELGAGTTFIVYLPVLAEVVLEAVRPDAAPVQGGDEIILVVEDEPGVLSYIIATLSAQGYAVLTAPNVTEALGVFDQQGGRIKLLLADVVMPHGSGRELADELQRRQPGVKVLFMSGYTDDAIAHHRILESGAQFIQKPFSPQQLAAKVRMVLDK